MIDEVIPNFLTWWLEMQMRLAFLLFLLGCFGTAHAGWFGPKNYDECILENMKGVTLKQAVWAIQNSCRAKFPEACYAWQREQEKNKKQYGLYIGYVKGNYRYNGGDPSKRENWLETTSWAYSKSPPEGCDEMPPT